MHAISAFLLVAFSLQCRAPTRRAASTAGPNSLSFNGEDAEFEVFCQAAAQGANLVPLHQRIFSDQLTPVLAYRCLVKDNDVDAPSYLLESVVNGDQQGRYSFVGAMPALEVVASRNRVTVLDHARGTRETTTVEDPMDVSGRQLPQCGAPMGRARCALQR